MERELVETGIEGLDELMGGGLIKGSTSLMVGAPGTGKTIAAIQFIFAGAKKGEACLFITSEQNSESIIFNAQSLGIDLKKLVGKGLVSIYEQPIDNRGLLTLEIPLNMIKANNVKRVAIDSITLFRYLYTPDVQEFRRGLLRFISTMKNAGVTLMATSERASTDFDTFDYQAEDFLFDGLIILSKIRKSSSFERVLHIAKIRGVDHAIDIYPFTIEEGGIKVHPKQLPFSLLDKDFTKQTGKK